MKLSLHLMDEAGAITDPRVLLDGTMTLGRSGESDWVLEDPERTISKLHCRIDRSADGFLLTDMSTNGVFINGDPQPLGRGHARALADGDTIVLGPYTLKARLEPNGPPVPLFEPVDATGATMVAPLAAGAYLGVPETPGSPIVPIPKEPWLEAIPSGEFGPDRRAGPIGWEAPPDPADYAASGQSATELVPGLFATEFAQSSEHLSAESTLMRTPTPQTVLPTDWNDIDPMAGLEPARSNMASDILAPAPAVYRDPEPMPAPIPAWQPASPLASPAVTPPVGLPDTLPASVPHADQWLAGFMEATGLPPETLAGVDMREAGRDLGRLVLAALEGVRDVLATRAMVKSELRIDQTIVQATDNNALKFAPDTQRCLAAMVGQPPPSFLPGSTSMQQALDDLKRHELALVAALNSVFTDLATRLDPEAILAKVRAENALGSALPMMREARAWALYEDAYRTLQDGDGTQNTGGSLLSPLASAYARQVRRVAEPTNRGPLP